MLVTLFRLKLLKCSAVVLYLQIASVNYSSYLFTFARIAYSINKTPGKYNGNNKLQ